jgi:hypothetical protein
MDKVTNDSGVSMNQHTQRQLLLTDTLPSFAAELRQLLIEKGEPDLATQVPELIVHRHQSSTIRAKPPG